MIDIRTTRPDERRAAADVTATALMFPRLTDEDWAIREASPDGASSVTAWDGDRCVGHVAGLSTDTTVPGGARLTTLGVSRVGVLPTHTRRGLLSGMIRQLLVDAHDAGTILSSLRASEAVIYERYGFGMAADVATVSVTSATARPVRDPAPGSMRLLVGDEVIATTTEIYERCGRWRPGTIARWHHLRRRFFGDAVSGEKTTFVAVHENVDGVADGYVLYEVGSRPAVFGRPEVGLGTLHDLVGADPSVERALWAYLLGIDLIDEWEAGGRPIDEPIRFALRDPRSYRVHATWDEQWVRLLDVDAALSGRSYGSCHREITIAVTDRLLPANDGTWQIDRNGARRVAGASALEADLAVDVAVVGAAYLGGTSWSQLAGAGKVEVRRAEALLDVDTLFASHPAPFCGTFF